MKKFSTSQLKLFNNFFFETTSIWNKWKKKKVKNYFFFEKKNKILIIFPKKDKWKKRIINLRLSFFFSQNKHPSWLFYWKKYKRKHWKKKKKLYAYSIENYNFFFQCFLYFLKKINYRLYNPKLIIKTNFFKRNYLSKNIDIQYAIDLEKKKNFFFNSFTENTLLTYYYFFIIRFFIKNFYPAILQLYWFYLFNCYSVKNVFIKHWKKKKKLKKKKKNILINF